MDEKQSILYHHIHHRMSHSLHTSDHCGNHGMESPDASSVRIRYHLVWYIVSHDYNLGYGYEMRINQNSKNIQGG